MNLEPSQITYLKRTLGVSSVILPEKASGDSLQVSHEPSLPSATEDVPFRLLGPETAGVYVVSERELSAEEASLLSNILKAIGETQLTLLIPESPAEFSLPSDLEAITDKRLLAFDDLVFSMNSGLRVGQVVKTSSGSSILLTANLAAMLEGSPETVQAAKRTVWGHLKAF